MSDMVREHIARRKAAETWAVQRVAELVEAGTELNLRAARGAAGGITQWVDVPQLNAEAVAAFGPDCDDIAGRRAVQEVVLSMTGLKTIDTEGAACIGEMQAQLRARG